MGYEQKRVGFAIINGELVFQKERKKSEAWLKGDYNMSDPDFELTIRGGLFEDRITLSLGSNYDSVNLAAMPATEILIILQKYSEVYGKSASVIHNGQFPATEGEDWLPRQLIHL
ncbi:MAG: hypothetical protein NC548_11360 [Lachnospiraceae bacterium]|nr:hypothetical protein [Lachnospiraceae bacterium]